MNRIFFDTEFTGLFAEAKLISIGLIDEHGFKSFYAETLNNYALQECSDFCKKEVLCHLQGKPFEKSIKDLREQLIMWLKTFKRVQLICDNSKDKHQLEKLLHNKIPSNCEILVLGLWGNFKRNFFNVGSRLNKKHNLRLHHALDDAKINRIILIKKFPI